MIGVVVDIVFIIMGIHQRIIIVYEFDQRLYNIGAISLVIPKNPGNDKAKRWWLLRRIR